MNVGLICSSMPNLGPLYNCAQVNDVGVFRLSTGRDCNHNIHKKEHDLHYFQATIPEPYVHTTVRKQLQQKIVILECCTGFPTTGGKPQSVIIVNASGFKQILSGLIISR